ncbi:MAG: hypothetical protein RJA70_3038 [Pseudomonadota bacterium]|jgi:ribulose-5-phosphate 4-epimerase/fuculose-1-phosphate aldolase
MLTESEARESVVYLARTIFERGLTPGSSANMSVRIEGGFIITPTNSCFGFLKEHELSRLDSEGKHVDGPKPSKEFVLHKAMYDKRPNDGAIVHLHSTYATLVSCFAELDPKNAVLPLTPYLLMRLGRVATIPYFPPGDVRLADELALVADCHAGVLMENHGPIVSADSPEGAVYSMEELEESCKLMVLSQGLRVRPFTPDQIRELAGKYGSRNAPQC